MANNKQTIDEIEAILDEFAGDIFLQKQNLVGYPVNQKSKLIEFYRWLSGSGLNLVMSNNVGDPFIGHSHYLLNTQRFEKEALEMMGPLYGFDLDELWGIITFSGTDGNNHGIYFGANSLIKKTKQRPVVYVSTEAHYSNKRLADLQNLETKLIPADINGCMMPEELEKAIVPDKPALVVYAIGTTFKGGVDNMDELNAVFAKYPNIQVYRHLDAALFGGYLPYSEYKDYINRKIHPFDSIAISGHKFFGMDEPAGFYITSKEVLNNQNPNNVPYLDCDMPMINCSRSSLSPLKLWWILKHTSKEDFIEQTSIMMENAKWLKHELEKLNWPVWLQPMSNTVYFAQPPEAIVNKYGLAPDYDERLGGPLAHVVVMQHTSKELLQKFLDDLKASI